MDGQSTESKRRQARSLVLNGPLPDLPQAGGAFTVPTAISFNWLPPPPGPSMECELLRKAKPSWRAVVTGGFWKPRVEALRGSLLRQLHLGSLAAGWESVVAH